MDGNMVKEFEYRTKQVDEMAKRLYYAPFTPKDAEMVYLVQYKPAIRYPLPVTLFDTKQLNVIQQKFIYNLLPKIGINRHMPRAVVYGPISMGGMGIMDLQLEQPVYAFKTMLGHMRRNDKAGKVILANLYDTQAEIGISILFYRDDHRKYTYATKNTCWHYMWKICNEMGISLEIECMWTPQPKAEKDQNLMEDAVKDVYFMRKQNWKLEVINNCRRYLGVYYISKLMDGGGNVNRDYLNGSAKVYDSHNREAMRKPPKQAWAEWKCFIFRNYLIKGYQVYPPIGTRLYARTQLRKVNENK